MMLGVAAFAAVISPVVSPLHSWPAKVRAHAGRGKGELLPSWPLPTSPHMLSEQQPYE